MSENLISILLATILIFASLSLVACQNAPKCEHVAGDEVYYAESDGIVTVSYKCVKCEKGSDKIIETVKADAVVTDEDNNSVTKAQNNVKGSMVLCLKKGFYEMIYVVPRVGSLRIICESGVDLGIVQFSGDTTEVTLENGSFKVDPREEKARRVKFETAAGNSYWSNITIKNCYFEGNAYIDSAWKAGVVENLTVENCVFKNITDNYDGELKGSATHAIYIGETWGTTTIKDCVFDGVEFSAIRFGEYSVEGETIIENCYFANAERYACIYFKAKNETLAGASSSLTINNCVFDDDYPIAYYRYDSIPDAQLHVGKNTWKTIPESIPNANTYDKSVQLELS